VVGKRPEYTFVPLYGMSIVYTLIGIALIRRLLDVFQTLFHPAGRGALSDGTARAVWRLFRKLASPRPGVLTYAGPVAIVSIILTWAVFTLVGFALIYLPHMGNQYIFQPGVNPGNHHGFWEAMSDSIGALITVSQGILPKPEWLALLRGLEAIIGFGLPTASVSWVLSIYPVLEERRSLAQRALYRTTSPIPSLPPLCPAAHALVTQVTPSRVLPLR